MLNREQGSFEARVRAGPACGHGLPAMENKMEGRNTAEMCEHSQNRGLSAAPWATAKVHNSGQILDNLRIYKN